MIEILILSFIQGITEFIPVSSSSHLIIISEYFKFNNQSLEIDVSLHIGSFIAVIFFFRKDIFNFIQNKDLFLKIIIGSIPVMITGYFLVEYDLIKEIRNIKIIGWTTLLFGILLFMSDKFETKKTIDSSFTLKTAVIIGFFQVLSLIPGVSRAGITITGARVLKFSRYDSAKISFLLSIPTLAAVSFFGLNNLIKSNNFNFSFLMIISIVLSFFFSLITIKFFLRFIKNFNLNLFVFYRVVLGIILILISYL
tara:strand:+ start:261 stop:1019 length:759 start_codon:yes stop_codon:yes gene_type:complete